MSDFENPYQSPESPVIPDKSQSSGITLSETTLQYISETSPWLRFIGIVGYIGSGLLCLMGIITAIVMFATSNLTGELGQYPLWVFPLIYLPFGVLIFFPAHFIFRFGQKIRSYQFSHSNEDLETGFKYNKSYWKFIGILYIIYLAAIPFSIVIAMVAGVAVALNM
jgi:hypothetical protein